MRIHYQNYLTSYAQKLRKDGNLSEVLLWNELKKDKLGYRFLRQRPIGKYIVDFYCPLLRLVVEIDGVASHDVKLEQDQSRQRALELQGMQIIRFMDAEVRYNLRGVMMHLRSEILRLADVPPPLEKEE